jgi:hypothetical protein
MWRVAKIPIMGKGILWRSGGVNFFPCRKGCCPENRGGGLTSVVFLHVMFLLVRSLDSRTYTFSIEENFSNLRRP